MRSTVKIIVVSSFALLLCAGASLGATKNEIRQMITNSIVRSVRDKHPGYGAADIRVYYKYADSTFNALTNRPGKISFEISEMYPDFDPVGDVIIPFQVYVGSREAEKIFLRTKVEVWMNVVVASQRLGKKQLLKEGDLQLSRRDIGGISKRFFVDPDGVLGKEMISSVPKDAVIQEWMVRVPPEVSKNDDVSIVAENEGLKVTARGLALEDGYKGEKIKVRNVDSNKEFKAAVVGSGEVSVDIR